MNSRPPHRTTPYALPPTVYGNLIDQEGEPVTLHDYWIILRKYQWTIALFCLPIALITALSVGQEVRTYTATATLYLENQTPNIMGMIGVSSAVSGGGNGLDYYATQRYLLTSRSLAAQVIQDLGVDSGPDFKTYTEAPPSWVQSYLSPGAVMGQIRGVVASLLAWFKGLSGLTEEGQGTAQSAAAPRSDFEFGVPPGLIDSYLSGLTVNRISETQLISVSFTSLNPAFSQQVANAHVTAFIRTSLLTRFELTTEARQYLNAKVEELKVKLENSEEELNRFRKAHAIVPLERGESLVVDRLRGLNADLTQARSRRIELESLYRVVQRRDTLFLSQIIENPIVRQIKDQISALELEKASLATTFKPTYAGVTAIQEQIDQARHRLNQEVQRVVRSITSDYTAAQAREQALMNEMEQARQVALELQEKAIEAALLEREVDSDRTLYESVLKRSKETDLTGAVPISNIRVVDRADLPRFPDRTRGKRTLLLGALVGLLGGVGLAFLRNYLDNTLKTPEDIGCFLRLPTLGLVANVGQLKKHAQTLDHAKRSFLPRRAQADPCVEARGLVFHHHPLSLVSESYQAICTALLFSQPERPPRTILITSSQPKEGKTATAINIATTLARNGAPVLLIDADLRNGNCHRPLGTQNGRGLSNVLTGNREATDLIQTTPITNLWLLSRGDFPPNPAELLGSAKMGQLLESLTTRYAFIVIDSAPLLPITDTVLLATKVEGVVLVTKAMTVARHVVQQACERLAYVRAKILGVVLNQINLQSPEYKDYRTSHQSYYTAYMTDDRL
ncbi:MAG TPA: polysaccharide biosynthesis tyrosine autokinase [Alphaproteobacteria bacterium]|nr:polysaccharide biosynthesis tyrosine autokinase [Alphaproteobacteria bacterium]